MNKSQRKGLHKAIARLAKEIADDAERQAKRRDLLTESVAEVIFDGTVDALWAEVSQEIANR